MQLSNFQWYFQFYTHKAQLWVWGTVVSMMKSFSERNMQCFASYSKWHSNMEIWCLPKHHMHFSGSQIIFKKYCCIHTKYCVCRFHIYTERPCIASFGKVCLLSCNHWLFIHFFWVAIWNHSVQWNVAPQYNKWRF